jgi:hypothetical protein
MSTGGEEERWSVGMFREIGALGVMGDGSGIERVGHTLWLEWGLVERQRAKTQVGLSSC